MTVSVREAILPRLSPITPAERPRDGRLWTSLGTPEEQFWPYVMPEPNSGCWIWMGNLNRSGYGRVSQGGKRIMAHRVSFEIHKGALPAGMEIDHRCSVRCCVNPDHLEAVTHAENCRRTGQRKRQWNSYKTECPYGHPYSGVNFKGRRICHTCRARENRKYRARQRAARPRVGKEG